MPLRVQKATNATYSAKKANTEVVVSLFLLLTVNKSLNLPRVRSLMNKKMKADNCKKKIEASGKFVKR